MKACLALLLVAACGGSAVDHELAATPIIVDLYASAIDSTYSVTPPVSDTQCPAGPWGPDPSYNCYYTVLGAFTDTYQFTVPADAVYSAEVTGNHWHYCVQAGRAHPCYTESMTITSAFVVDSASNVLLQLVGNGDDWTGAVDLPAGDYSLLISGEVAGNRAGSYSYSVMVAP